MSLIRWMPLAASGARLKRSARSRVRTDCLGGRVLEPLPRTWSPPRLPSVVARANCSNPGHRGSQRSSSRSLSADSPPARVARRRAAAAGRSQSTLAALPALRTQIAQRGICFGCVFCAAATTGAEFTLDRTLPGELPLSLPSQLVERPSVRESPRCCMKPRRKSASLPPICCRRSRCPEAMAAKPRAFRMCSLLLRGLESGRISHAADFQGGQLMHQRAPRLRPLSKRG